MTDNTNAHGSEDEISLIDLFVVLLRHRRLIILSTIGSMILGLAMIVWLPGYQYSKAVDTQVVEGTTNFMISSALKAILGDLESTHFINQSLNDPQNILQALREAGYQELDDKTRIDASVPEQEALFSIRRRFLQNKSRSGNVLKQEQAVYKATIASGTGTISFKNRDEEKVSAFQLALINNMNIELAEYSRPQARSKLQALEALLSSDRASESTGLTMIQNHENYLLIKNYLQDGTNPVTILRQPQVFKTELAPEVFKQGVVTKAIVLVFAVFFMAVFAAFVLQFVESVKKDPESMGKIRDAMAKNTRT